MIDPTDFKESLRHTSLTEIIKARDSIIEKIHEYERTEPAETDDIVSAGCMYKLKNLNDISTIAKLLAGNIGCYISVYKDEKIGYVLNIKSKSIKYSIFKKYAYLISEFATPIVRMQDYLMHLDEKGNCILKEKDVRLLADSL